MEKSRTTKFLWNSVSTAMLQIVTMIAGFITPRVMLLMYGSEINGLVTSITQLVSYVNLVEAGLSNAATYALYKPLADKNQSEINSVVSAAKLFYLQAGHLFVSIVAILTVVYPLYINSNILSAVEVGVLVALIGANGALEFYTLAKYRVILTADQKTYVVSFASIVSIIINTLVVVCMAYAQASVLAMKAVALSALLARTLILMYYSRKHYPNIDYKAPPNKQALNKRWDALYLQVLGVIHRGAPVLLLTVVLKDLMLVSVYTIYNMIATSLNNLLGIFRSGLPASFGELIAKKETKALQKSYGEFEFIFYKLVLIIYAVAFVMIMSFIGIYTKGINDYNYHYPIIGFLIILDGVLYNIKTPQGMLVISAGLYKETRVQTTLQGAIALIGGAVLAVPFGITGILVASCISNLYRVIDLLFFIPKHVTGLPMLATVKRILIMVVSIAMIIGICHFIPMHINGYLSWALYACLTGIIATVVAALSGLLFERKEFFGVLKRLKHLVRR